MDISKLTDQLILHEGVRLKPYRDSVGKLTIGVGRNLDDVGITDEETRYLLRNDIARVQSALDEKLPWWKSLDDVRQRVIADMCFNMGINRLLGFKNMLMFAQNGKYKEASEAMGSSLWSVQVGSRATRLITMMRTGDD